MQELMSRVKHSNQSDAYEKFEEISMLVKRSKLNFEDPRSSAAVNAANCNQQKQQRRGWISQCKDLLNEVRYIFLTLLT